MVRRIIIISLFCIQFAHAQTDTTIAVDSVKTYKLNVLSNLEDAKVYIDTVFAGMTPLQNYELKKGIYKVRVLNSKSLKYWQNENQSYNIEINNDTTIYNNFKYYYFFNTNPFDASVFKSDSLIGHTPLRFFNDNELFGNLIIKKKNYKDFVYDLNGYDFETGANITLQPKGKEVINDIVYKNRGTQFETKRPLIPIITLGAASVGAAYLSVNFKNTANKAYDRFLLTGNPESLQTSDDNDLYFLFSLIAMQAAIGGLIYFLFFD
ncbi:MAG: PEGA domain-containing protein [bacterium]